MTGIDLLHGLPRVHDAYRDHRSAVAAQYLRALETVLALVVPRDILRFQDDAFAHHVVERDVDGRRRGQHGIVRNRDARGVGLVVRQKADVVCRLVELEARRHPRCEVVRPNPRYPPLPSLRDHVGVQDRDRVERSRTSAVEDRGSGRVDDELPGFGAVGQGGCGHELHVRGPPDVRPYVPRAAPVLHLVQHLIPAGCDALHLPPPVVVVGREVPNLGRLLGCRFEEDVLLVEALRNTAPEQVVHVLF